MSDLSAMPWPEQVNFADIIYTYIYFKKKSNYAVHVLSKTRVITQ